MRVHKTYNDLEEYFQTRGMETRFWQHEADHMLHVLVKPNLGQVQTPLKFTKQKIVYENSPWYAKRWARLLRWIIRVRDGVVWADPSNPIRWKLEKILRPPAWVRELLWAKAISIDYEYEELPAEVLERIITMIYYLKHKGVEPSKILTGSRAQHTLEREVKSYGYIVEPCPEGYYTTVFGLPIQVNPFLAKDAVVVC